MKADRPHVLPGPLKARAEISQATDAGQDLVVGLVTQLAQKGFRTGVEARIAGEQHGVDPLAPLPDDCGDIPGQNGLANPLPRRIHALHHAARADHALRLGHGAQHAQRPGVLAAHADAGHDHLFARRSESEFPLHGGEGLGAGEPLALGGPADDNGLRPGRAGRGDLVGVAAGAAGVLGDQPLRVHEAEHGRVELLGEGPLHGQNMARLQAALAAGLQRGGQREQSCPDPLAQTRRGAVFGDRLAPRGQQDVPLRAGEEADALGGVLYEDAVLGVRGALAQQADELRAGLFTGQTDALGDMLGIGMRGVHDQVEALGAEHPGHLRAGQSARAHLHVRVFSQGDPAVFGGHIRRDRHAAAREALDELPAVGGPGEYAELIHCGSRGALPCGR